MPLLRGSIQGLPKVNVLLTTPDVLQDVGDSQLHSMCTPSKAIIDTGANHTTVGIERVAPFVPGQERESRDQILVGPRTYHGIVLGLEVGRKLAKLDAAVRAAEHYDSRLEGLLKKAERTFDEKGRELLRTCPEIESLKLVRTAGGRRVPSVVLKEAAIWLYSNDGGGHNTWNVDNPLRAPVTILGDGDCLLLGVSTLTELVMCWPLGADYYLALSECCGTLDLHQCEFEIDSGDPGLLTTFQEQFANRRCSPLKTQVRGTALLGSILVHPDLCDDCQRRVQAICKSLNITLRRWEAHPFTVHC